MTFSPYDRLTEVSPRLRQLDSIPLTGDAPPFPWKEFADGLSEALGGKKIKVTPGEWSWRSGDALYEHLGDAPFPLTLSIPSLQGALCWVMPGPQVASLAALVLTHDASPLEVRAAELTEGFYRFLLLEALHHFSRLAPGSLPAPLVNDHTLFSHQEALCRDVCVTVEDQAFYGRLLLSPEFRRSWVEHFAQGQAPSLPSGEMAKCVDIVLRVEAGKTHLSLANWKAVQSGDFIVLDSVHLDPDRLEGRVLLTIEGREAFHASLEEGSLKILTLSPTHEVDTPMVQHPKDEEQKEAEGWDASEQTDDFEDESLFGDLDVDDLFADEEEEVPPSDEDERARTHRNMPPEEPSKEARQEEAMDALPEKNRAPITPEEIPVTLIVEIGRIAINMEQLLRLEPGNFLDVDLHPQNGVDLTINGSLVGKGELIRIGETLGVRVTQIGRSTPYLAR